MDERKKQHTDPWDNGVYGTGNTMPPKDHGGIIALLSIAIIFLSGIISVLSFLNIKLFQELQQVQSQADSIPMAFSSIGESSISDTTPLPEAYYSEESVDIPMLGLKGDHISKFDQRYFQWPAGLLITYVDADSNAQQLGIETGDILVSIDDTAITSQEILDSILHSHKAGDSVQLVIHRSGVQHSLTLTLTD